MDVTDEDYAQAYKAGYERTPYRSNEWGERLKIAYGEGLEDANQGFPPRIDTIDIDESSRAYTGSW